MIVLLPFGLAHLLAYHPALLYSCLTIFGPTQGQASCSDTVYQSLSDVVPPPYKVAQIANGPVLDEFRDSGQFVTLLAARSNIRSSVEMTNRDLTQRLPCALRRYAYVDGKKAGTALLREIRLIRKQVRYTMLNASQLHSLYSSLKKAYHEHNSITIKALERTQLNSRKS